MASQPDRPVHPARLEAAGLSPSAGGRSTHPDPPAQPRPDGPAAHARGGRRLPGRHPPGAYERVVDRLLASPHYGERWARPWLDLARYADSNGYSIDAPRSIWSYRDWVIDALNRDMPFDGFTIDQLAGDLRPGADPAQQVATGFHRNTPINQEGGIDLEQFRVESIVDRVNTTATVWLGLTVGCAQCHDHKYDPIAQREYYELFAFLNNADEPTIEIAEPEVLARRRPDQGQAQRLPQTARRRASRGPGAGARWEKTLTTDFTPTSPPSSRMPSTGSPRSGRRPRSAA